MNTMRMKAERFGEEPDWVSVLESTRLSMNGIKRERVALKSQLLEELAQAKRGMRRNMS